MAKVSGLSRRGSVWQVRVRVPDKPKVAIGRREIVKSPGSVAYAETARLAHTVRTEADRRFAEAEAVLRTQPIEELPASALHHLAQVFCLRMRREAEEESRTAPGSEA